MRFTSLTLGWVLSSAHALACWDTAAARYALSAPLLTAIALTESNLDPRAFNTNQNGSRDIGLMQINSWWLPTLARHGIQESDLWEPCTNIFVGAWILAQNIARHGYTWEAVGAYHSPSPAHRARYIDKVRRQLGRLEAAPRASSPPNQAVPHQP
jgi:soluble lytic murein transglycosylase-like protein